MTEDELLAKDQESKAMAEAIQQEQKRRIEARAEQLYQSLTIENDAVKKSLYERLLGDYDPQRIAERRKRESDAEVMKMLQEREASRKR